MGAAPSLPLPQSARFLIVVSMLFAGCDKKSPTIHYVLPNAYRGAFIIYTGQPDGVVLQKRSNEYTCVIPPSGVLKVKGPGPFSSWHAVKASFANGEPIRVAYEWEHLDKDLVAFWGAGGRDGGMLYDFIGTKQENEVFQKETATGDVKPGRVSGH